VILPDPNLIRRWALPLYKAECPLCCPPGLHSAYGTPIRRSHAITQLPFRRSLDVSAGARSSPDWFWRSSFQSTIFYVFYFHFLLSMVAIFHPSSQDSHLTLQIGKPRALERAGFRILLQDPMFFSILVHCALRSEWNIQTEVG
jgi:hypothetical protein